MRRLDLRCLCTSAAAFIVLASATARAEVENPTFEIDVVADCNRFISNGVPHPDANPGFGDTFMQEGLIYRGGTFDQYCPDTRDCGLNPDGSPEFPEAVIGKWTCYGAFVGDGAATPAGVWLYSTQVYDFDVEEIAPNVFTSAEDQIVSVGPERIDLDTPWLRSVTGGVGRFKHAGGEVAQVKIGFNATECENFTFRFKIRPRAKPR